MPKPNTCKPSGRRAKLERQLEGIQKHLAAYPNDKLSQQRMAVIEAELVDAK
jgi:hypothetical protein